MTDNRVPAQTTTGAQTWWQYNANGEATWVGKAPGGNRIEPRLGLLRAVSDSGNAHEFTYNPSGLRIRDKRAGTNSHDKRYIYTTGGTLRRRAKGCFTKNKDRQGNTTNIVPFLWRGIHQMLRIRQHRKNLSYHKQY